MVTEGIAQSTSYLDQTLLIIEFSIKSYVYPEIFSSAQKISLKRFFDSCARGIFVYVFGN